MDAIDVLMSEHRRIEKVIDELGRFAGTASASTPPAGLRPFVRFIREFADAAHHAKEEEILFVAMADAGFPPDAGPVAVMLHEHEIGRGYARALDALSSKASWTDADCAEVARAAAGYADLLLSHIQKEDQVLYPLARRALSPERMAKVDAACAEADARQRASGNEARWTSLGEGLRGNAAAG